MLNSTGTNEKKKPVRIWVDGCFDTMHYGHANALRQAKKMGDYLVVGVHSDADIEQNKGPTVMKESERYLAVSACKWVDQVVENAPYLTHLSYLDQYNCDFCVHGDDVTTMADGTDCYSAVKNANRYKECKRTEGISTTDLVQRMLTVRENPNLAYESLEYKKRPEFIVKDTQEKLKLFSNERKPGPHDKVVYVAGAFDLFHVGHIEFLRKAKEAGTFVVVGIYSDETIFNIKESRYSIMNMQERALSVLACRHADDIILDAPYAPDESFFVKHGIHVVLTTQDSYAASDSGPFAAARKLGLLQEIPRPEPHFTTDMVVDRIIANYAKFQERNRRKMQKSEIESALKSQQQIENSSS